jgi:dipeptidyl aminopeptidase/acylaminoacyl peptidase
MDEQSISFESDGLKLVGVLRYPERREGKIPGVLLVHGSMDDDRDGNMLRHPDGRKVYKKNFFLEISRNLCAAGFATFAWDRRGMGESEGPEQRGDIFSTVRDTKAALDTLCSQDIVDPGRIAVAGQSAGVYTTCLLAKNEDTPKVYVLQGGLYRDFNGLMTFNYARVKDYAEKSPENLLWIEKNDLWGLALGIHHPLMENAAKEGKTEYEITYKDRSWTVPLNTPSRKPEYASSNQFKYIQKPVLLIHGEYDLNVPIEDVYLIEKELRANGNNDIELVVIPNADHSFQEVAEDEDTRLRERMSLESFRRPYKREFFDAVIDYLRRRL